MSHPPPRVTTVILAGGQGTRLSPLTLKRSKPAISYGGKYRLIDIPISNSLHSGFHQIFVIAQYLSAELQHHIQQTYHFSPLQQGAIDVLTPEEDAQGNKAWFEGTADAVRKSLPNLLKTEADYFLILAGDHLYNIDFQKLIDFARETEAEVTIASIPIAERETLRMGVVKVDPSQRVVDFVEKPKDPSLLSPFRHGQNPHHPYLGSMGIYVFQREALLRLLSDDPRPDFGHHLLSTAVKEFKTYAFIYDGYWEDIGTVASYYHANLLLTEERGGLNTYNRDKPIFTRSTFLPGPKVFSTHISRSVLCEGSVIEAAEISHSLIGLCSHIGRGTIVRDAVLMGNFGPLYPGTPLHPIHAIGENCLIEKAILDENVQIGNGVKLTNRKGLLHHEEGGLFVRDGIIIVTAGTILPDGFEF